MQLLLHKLQRFLAVDLVVTVVNGKTGPVRTELISYVTIKLYRIVVFAAADLIGRSLVKL